MGEAVPLQRKPGDAAAPRWRRLAAAAIDVAACFLVAMVFAHPTIATALRVKSRLLTVATVLLTLGSPILYALFRDSLGGKSIGKLIIGLTTVIERSGRPAGFAQSLVRNISFAILALAFSLLIVFKSAIRRSGLMILGISVAVLRLPAMIAGFQITLGKTRRRGDRAAGTLVIRDEPTREDHG